MNSENRASDEARVWLAPHEGVERVPVQGDSVCPWPEPRQHARKFLQVHGCAIQKSGQTLHGEVCVWAEYEAPTHARPVHSEGQGPRYVQTPLITVSEPQAETDPWIFQPGFVWSTWGQENAGHSALQADDPSQPQPGDMVLFGSPMPGRRGKVDWVLDTVVVLRRRLPGPTAGQLKNPYGKLVEPALRGQSTSLLPFVGQPHERAAHFSFAPCKLTTSRDDGCFQRPNISELFDELRLENGGERPSASVALAACRPHAGLDRFWQQLTGLVWSHGLALGADFDLPAIRVLNANRESKSAARKKRARAA